MHSFCPYYRLQLKIFAKTAQMTSYCSVRITVLLYPFNGYLIFKKQFSKNMSVTICNVCINHNGKCIVICVPHSGVDRLTGLREFATRKG